MGRVGSGGGRSAGERVLGRDAASDWRRVDLPAPDGPVMRVSWALLIWWRRRLGGGALWVVDDVCLGMRPKGRRALVARSVMVAGVVMAMGARDRRRRVERG